MQKFLIPLFIAFFAIGALAQETDCPFGFVNDPAPGSCGLYIDADGNNICDLSEVLSLSMNTTNSNKQILSEDELKLLSVAEMARYYKVSGSNFAQALSEFLKVDIKTSDNIGALHDSVGLCTGVAAQIATGLESELITKSSKSESTQINTKPAYSFVSITLMLIILYGITYILALQKRITIVTHRKIWNIILTITFLVSGILGLLLVLRINYGWFAEYYLKMLRLHVNFGMAMVIITFFHMAWHLPYYKNLILKKSD